MMPRELFRRVRPLAFLVCGLGIGWTLGEGVAWGQASSPSGSPTVRLADRTPPAPNAARAVLSDVQPNEHPLMPALRWARTGLSDLEKIQDYSATVVKRERIDGKLRDPETVFVKIRHKPFSVYMYFLHPDSLKGQQAIYVQGANANKLMGHGNGVRKVFGWVPLDPTGPIAMQGNRYPITELGVLNLVRRLIEVGEKDLQYGECEVKFYPGAKINGRVVTCVAIVHPVPRRNFLYHMARVFVDDELNVPVRFEAYEWPEKPGGPPELLEEYTYLNLKLNNGFTDADFDVRNPNYGLKSANFKSAKK